MRELARELRDEGDEGAGRRAREKKKNFEEERREAGEREKEMFVEREKREKGNK